MKWTLPEMARILHVQSDLPDCSVAGTSIDTRTLQAGDLFGAVAALVHSQYDSPESRWPLLRVSDPLSGLQTLAAAYRDTFRMRVIGITGSNGKTTTKEMIADVLSTTFPVVRSQGNLNNHIGVPLTILNWPDHVELAVVEMGTNHFGEISKLCKIARPTHGLITNIGKGHIGYLESLDGVLRAKSELIEGLSGDRVVFLNGDDPLLLTAQHQADYTILYGFSEECDVQAEDLGVDSEGCPAFRIGSLQIQLQIPGRHQASNAVAACAVGRYFGVADAQIKDVLEAYTPVDKRMQMEVIHGITLINDTYNANPSSMEAALVTLAETQSLKRRFVVLGDMLELGDHADAEHRQIGRRVAELSLDGLLTYGSLMGQAVQIAQEEGVQMAGHFNAHEDIAELLAEEVRPGDGVLVKGSRGMRMERVAVLLKQILTQTESE
jgi:UDP-N-acetylmuramoyl-tripeptide--D-alanyl-D-alanine ligase